MNDAGECYVYIIGRVEGPVKIGVSSSPIARISMLQTGCPFKLRLLHAVKCKDRRHAFNHEQQFHRSWAAERLNGEWFDIEADQAYTSLNANFEVEEFLAVSGSDDYVQAMWS